MDAATRGRWINTIPTPIVRLGKARLSCDGGRNVGQKKHILGGQLYVGISCKLGSNKMLQSKCSAFSTFSNLGARSTRLKRSSVGFAQRDVEQISSSAEWCSCSTA